MLRESVSVQWACSRWHRCVQSVIVSTITIASSRFASAALRLSAEAGVGRAHEGTGRSTEKREVMRTMSMWQEIRNTVLSEFSDIPDATQIARITLRLLVAAALGGLLGYEREKQGKSAGVRTHMLVAIGAALFVLIPQQAGAATADLTRVLQGLVAGVGFLGAGAIILGTKQVETRGLTTAAGIWVTAAIGVAAGMGRESTAVLSTLVALFVLSVVPWIVRDNRKSKE
jgi:putative Mg2+ transporter-C (MgtC) family protein